MKEKKKIIVLLIHRHIIDDEDEEHMFKEHGHLRRNISEICTNRRKNGGIFKMLINNHLVDEEQRFKSYFPVGNS